MLSEEKLANLLKKMEPNKMYEITYDDSNATPETQTIKGILYKLKYPEKSDLVLLVPMTIWFPNIMDVKEVKTLDETDIISIGALSTGKTVY